MNSWLITGKGRCASARGYIIAETAEGAVAKLTRSGACEDFVVGTVEPGVPSGSGASSEARTAAPSGSDSDPRREGIGSEEGRSA